MFITWCLRVKLDIPDLTWRHVELRDYSVELDEDEMTSMAADMLNEEREDPTVKTRTVIRHLAGVRRYLEALGVQAPLAKYRGPVAPPGEPHPLQGGEGTIDKMIESADGHTQKEALCALVGYMGLRISEARTVRPEHVNIIERELLIRGKYDRWTKMPIPRKAVSILFRASEEAELNEWDFILNIEDKTARNWFTELAGLALGRKMSTDGREGSHSARMAVGTDVYNATKDLVLTQRILRHRDPRTTVGYIETDAQRMRDILEKRNGDEDRRSA